MAGDRREIGWQRRQSVETNGKCKGRVQQYGGVFQQQELQLFEERMWKIGGLNTGKMSPSPGCGKLYHSR